jgi:uncharacterized membrane protein YhaH (DUF805 family)
MGDGTDGRITLSAARVSVALGVVSLAVCAGSFLGQYSKLVLGHDTVFGLVELLHVDSEGNLPAWLSSAMLLGVATLAGLTAAAARRRGDRLARYWWALACLFVFLSLDEVSEVHEQLIHPVRYALDLSGVFYWSWVIVGLALVPVFGLAFIPFMRALPRRTTVLLLLAGGVYLAGALGLEMASGYYYSRVWERDIGYQLITTVEELLEMEGTVLFLYAVLDHMRRESVAARVTVAT